MTRLYRINMSTQRCESTPVPPEFARLGGRGFSSTLIAKEVNPNCSPRGPDNKLVIAPGILAGTVSPCSQRVSVGGKSPLTGGIKEANAGGTSGQKLGRLGIAAIVLEGKAKPGQWHILRVSREGAVLEDGGFLQGAGNYRVAETLRAKYGRDAAVISIGPAGEMLMSAATVAMTDQDGNPARHAARGGLGAVMGSKGVKAIVIDDAGMPKIVPAKDQQAFKKTAKDFAAVILERPRVKHRLHKFGTAGLISFTNEVNSLPTRNFSRGQFERVEKISGEAVAALIDARGGERGHACYQGCIVRCSNKFNDAEGKHLTSSFEYETIAMLGSNLDIFDIDAIARMDRLCDDYGVDTIEIGCALGVAMEANVLPFGDAARAMEAIHEVGKGTVLGRVIGNGAVTAGRVFGVERVPAIKGQGLPAWDPRTALATGVTFITSPQGADHTAGRLQGVMEFDRLKPGTIAQLSKEMQIRACFYDTVGLCHFADGTPESAEWLARLLSAFYGEHLSVDYVMEVGQKILETELQFNLAAGFTEADDRLPEFMLKEPLPPTNATFSVPREEIREAFAGLKKKP